MIDKSGSCPPKCAVRVCCGLQGPRKTGVANLKKGGNKIEGDGDIDKYMCQVVERLQQAEFLSGAEMGMLDLSLYGITYVWAGNPTMKTFQDVIDKYELFGKWWLKMFQAVGEVRNTGS